MKRVFEQWLSCMHKIQLMAILSLLVLSLQSTYAQSICNTSGGIGSIGAIEDRSDCPQKITDEPIYIRIYVHPVGKSNGTDAPSIDYINSSLNYLYIDFKPHNIFFIRDCDMTPIYSDEIYYAGESSHIECTLPLYSNHPDGIDVFIGGDNATPYNAAITIPGKTMIVKGTYVSDGGNENSCTEGFQWVNSRSHTISHEMGHCLGLWHTHHGVEPADAVFCNGALGDPYTCEELADGTNAANCGDYVCDTPADPKLKPCPYSVSDKCNYETGEMDSQGHLYHPDSKLIMSYSHNSCKEKFSFEQGFRMQKMILQVSAILQACIIKSDFTGLTISNITEWSTANTPNNGNLWIEGNLEIKDGATLTINSGVTVHFSKNSKLIIEPNARLILYGTLTSRGCSGFTWQGVKVYGSGPDKSQYPTSGQYWQGRIDCRSGSLIENAITGVQLFGPTENLTGGQIRCSGATIKNCTRGVQFKPYRNFWPFAGSQQGQPRNYVGSFSRTVFITDDNYDIFQFPNTNFFAFVDMSGVDGISIAGCTFKNEKHYNYTDQQMSGCGIFASDAGFNVIPAGNISNLPADYAASEFNGLGRGIHAINMEINHPYIVKEATFNSCYYGIRNDGVSGATLLFNNFNLGKVPWAETDEEEGPTDQIGILFENDISGFTCEENNFTRVNGQPEVLTIGINSINTGEMNKNIRRNTFTGLHIGNLANQKNAFVNPPGDPLPTIRGLNYDCNKNFNVAGFGAQNGLDFSVPNGLIRPRQGLEKVLQNGEIAYLSAGNQFSYSGVDFANFGVQIKYHFDPLGTKEEPLVTMPPNGVTKLISPSNTCTQSFCEPPCKTDGELVALKSDFLIKKTSLQILDATIGSNPTEQQNLTRAYYQHTMDQNAFLVAQHIMYDTTHYNQDSLRTWVLNMNSMEGDIWLAKDYLSSGLLQQANNILDAMPTKYHLDVTQQATIANIKAISAAVNGQDPNNLNETVLQTIKPFAYGTNDYARSWARRLLTRNGWYFVPEYIKYGHSSEERNKKPSKTVDTEILKVFPNPANDYVVFNLSNTTISSVLRIFDINGRQIAVFCDLRSGTETIWQTSNVSSGIYVYQLITDGKSFTGKVQVNK